MKTLNVFARYFAIIAMLILTNQSISLNAVNDQCDVCYPQLTKAIIFESPGMIASSQTIDPIYGECTVLTYFKLSHYMCPGGPDYYEYEIDSIVILGNCTGISQDELLKRSTKSIIASRNQWAYSPSYIRTPRCVKKLSSRETYIPCNSNDCCVFRFDSHWTIYGGELDSIHDIKKNPDGPPICTDGNMSIPGSCSFRCAREYLPPNGELNTWQYLPPACSQSCYYLNQSTDHTAIVRIDNTPYPESVFSAGYMLGLSDEEPPCFGIHSFSISSNPTNMSDEDILKSLILKAVSEIYNQTQSQIVRMLISKCWRQVDPAYEYFVGCSDEDCCMIEFMITQGTPLTAQVITNQNTAPSCISPCNIDICSEFNINSYHYLPKQALDISNWDQRTNIKLLPNPTTGELNVEFNTINSGIHTLKIVDLTGYEVYSRSEMLSEGENSLQLNLTKIPSGTYYIQIIQNGHIISNAKFIRN